MVKNGCDHLVHEILKSIISKEWVHEVSWFFSMLTVMQLYFIRPTLSFYLWLWKCQSTAVVLVEPLAVAKMVLWNRVIWSLGFSEFWDGARNPYQVVCDSQIFWENFFCQRNWRNGSKISLTENFILFAVFLHKCYIWGKIRSWDIGQNAVSQSDSRIFKSTISLEQMDETA